jgi:hypothetical protein
MLLCSGCQGSWQGRNRAALTPLCHVHAHPPTPYMPPLPIPRPSPCQLRPTMPEHDVAAADGVPRPGRAAAPGAR